MAVPGPWDKDKKKKNTNENSKTNTTVGEPTVVNSKSRITGKDGQVGVRRTKKIITPTKTKTEFTPEGDKAYAAKSKTDQIAQDKAWNKMRQSKDVKVTNIDNFGARNVQPEGIKNLRPDTKSPKIEVAKKQSTTAMFANTGSNRDNMKFGGSNQSFISSEQRGNSASYETSGSKGQNSSTSVRLSDNQAKAVGTPYAKGRTTAPSEDLATRMNKKEDARTATVVKRAEGTAKKMAANKKRVAENKRNYKG